MKLLLFVAWLSILWVSSAFAGGCCSSEAQIAPIWIVTPPENTPGKLEILCWNSAGKIIRKFEMSRFQNKIQYLLTFESPQSYLNFRHYFQLRGYQWRQSSTVVGLVSARLDVAPENAHAVFESIRFWVPGIPSSACLRDIVPAVGIVVEQSLGYGQQQAHTL